MSDPKADAIRWLNRMFGVPEGYGNGTIELIVDNLVKAAVAEMKAVDKDSLTTGVTTEESSAVQSISSGGSGGASVYGGKGLGIAGVAWPPETRITVNGKTFCLADIDKEMTE